MKYQRIAVEMPNRDGLRENVPWVGADGESAVMLHAAGSECRITALDAIASRKNLPTVSTNRCYSDIIVVIFSDMKKESQHAGARYAGAPPKCRTTALPAPHPTN